MVIDATVIALAGVIVAGIAALASPVGDWLVARSRQKHEAQQAREDRRQRRLEATYAETSEYLLLVRDYVRLTEPAISIGDPPAPTFPDVDTLRHREASMVIHGSREVLDDLQALSKLTNTFRAHVWQLQAEREGNAPTQFETWQMVEADRKAVHAAVDALLVRINAELAESRSDES